MKKLSLVLFFILLVFCIAFFSLPYYVRQALLHQQVDIDDYIIFENDTVNNSVARPWSYSNSFGDRFPSDSLRAQIEAYRPVAFVLIQQDSVLYEEYWQEYTDTTFSNTFSVTKSIVAILTGIALDEGLIEDIDDPVYKYLPEFDNLKNESLSIRSLLSMSSGLNWDEAYHTLFSPTTEAYYGNDLAGMIRQLELVHEPNTVMYYSSMDTQILAFIIQKVSGCTISEYMQEKLWKKLGTEHMALWAKDSEKGIAKAYCCFTTHAKDLARIGALVLNNGLYRGDTIVSASFIEEMTTPMTYLTDEKGAENDYYGYQWWIIHYKGFFIPYARGVNGQYVFVIPELDAVAVRLGNDRSRTYEGSITLDIKLYLDAVLQMLGQDLL